MISILLPSRGRPELLRRFLQSVTDCAHGPVEVVVRLDDDDFDNYADVMRDFGLSRGVVWIQSAPGVGMGVMTNECLAAARGDIIMLAGDDMVVRTHRFDTLVESLMPPDGVALIYGNDGLQGQNLATHPFIGRATIRVWGDQVCSPEYKAEYIDTHIMDTFCRLAGLGHRRILYVPDLITEHMHYLNGKAPLDDTYRNKPMALRESAFIYEANADKRQQDAKAMARIIEEAQA